ncbi:hypothetical protein scyTo_0018813, partial [Scyliorhinus torazame]|nr:hypothetical protein [Scyliorhinus torazame]
IPSTTTTSLEIAVIQQWPEEEPTVTTAETPTTPTKAIQFVTSKKKRTKEKPTHKPIPAMRVITRKKIPIEETPTLESIPEVPDEEFILEGPTRAINAIRFVNQDTKTSKEKPLPETPLPEVPLHESIPDIGFVSPEMESADIKSEDSTIAPIPGKRPLHHL